MSNDVILARVTWLQNLGLALLAAGLSAYGLLLPLASLAVAQFQNANSTGQAESFVLGVTTNATIISLIAIVAVLCGCIFIAKSACELSKLR
jgi:hypothetical protein